MTRTRPRLAPPQIVHTVAKGETAALMLKQPSDGQIYERTLFTGSGREVVVGFKGEVQRDLTFSECRFEAQVGPDGLANTFWLARLYELVRASFIRCEFQPATQDARVLEHAIYGNVPAGLTVSGCRFERISSNAVQTVWNGREGETMHPELADDLTYIVVEDSIAIGCGRADGPRAAFAFSFFPGPGGVIVCRCALRSHQRAFNAHGGTWNSFGAIMAEGHREVGIHDVDVDYLNPDRPVIQLVNDGEVWIRNVHVEHAGLVRIKGCSRVHVEDCTGKATLEIDGVKKPGAWTSGYSHGAPVVPVPAMPAALRASETDPESRAMVSEETSGQAAVAGMKQRAARGVRKAKRASSRKGGRG